ncbi:MAG: SpoIIE family protein phosphatase [Victivallaceae bacterium]|nr:SpoIIE family protein phosphatase [Victivallaceae bacterium]
MKIYGKAVKILAVDSDTVNLLLLEESLKNEGIEIDCCSAGDKALTLLKKSQYDVVLMDVIMPDMDGFELRKHIREHDQYLPIIYLTAVIDTAHNHLLEKIAADPATYYIKKPFELSCLLETIKSVVSTYLSENETRRYYSSLEGDLNLASEVQHLLLPDWIRVEDDLVMSSFYRPMDKVSGDIFEAIRVSPGRYFVLLGDIAGHGIQAALYMSAIQALVKTIITVSMNDVHIDDVLNRLNSFFCVDMQKKSYMTCLAALFDFNINKLQFISAGHLSFFMHNAKTDEVKLLNAENRGAIPVGWITDYNFDAATEAVEMKFDDDCRFFGITDGVIEMCDREGTGLGTDKLRELIRETTAKTIAPLVPYYVCNAACEAGYSVIEDDICMIMVKKKARENTERLLLATMPNIAHADMLGIACEKFIIRNTRNERLAVEVELLLNEFLNNIIMHGLEKRQQESPKILVNLELEERKVCLSVWDKGRQWSFDTSTGVTLDEHIWDYNSKMATAGRGMAIMKSIAEKIECKRYGDLNETSFVIKREG